MPCIIWCDRIPYPDDRSVWEVVDQIAALQALDDRKFIAVDGGAVEGGKALSIDAITSIVPDKEQSKRVETQNVSER